MEKYRFIYSLIHSTEQTTLHESTAFVAENETQAQVSVEAFVRLRLGMLYKPERIDIEWGEGNRIYGVTIGTNNFEPRRPILAGEIHLESDVLAAIEEHKAQASEGEDEGGNPLKKADVPTV